MVVSPDQPAESPRASATPSRGSIVRPSIVYIALYMAVGAYFPYIAVYLSSTGLSLSLVGLFMSLSAAVGLIAAPVWGAIADQVRNIHRPYLVAAILSAAAATWLATVREPLTVGLGIVVLSAGSAGLGPMVDSRVVELMGADRDRFARARAWGSISFIVGSLAVGWLVAREGEPSMFWVYVPLLLLSGLAVWFLLGGFRHAHGEDRMNPFRALPAITSASRRSACSSSARRWSGPRSTRWSRSSRSTSSRSVDRVNRSACSGGSARWWRSR